MNLYTCTDFEGFYPVGFAAIVIAEDEVEARKLFEEAVVKECLQLQDKFGRPHLYTLELVPTIAHARILVNGDY